MSNKINLDDVFRNGLKPYKETFDEGAWKNMSDKLGATSKPKYMLPFISRRIINLLILGGVFSISATLFFLVNANSSTQNAKLFSAISQNRVEVGAKHNYTPVNPGASFVSNMENRSFLVQKDKSVIHSGTPAAITMSNMDKESKVNYEKTVDNESNNKVVAYTIENARFKPQFKAASAVMKRTKKIKLKRWPQTSDHYNCATIGLHLESLVPLNSFATSGQKPGMGFDIEGYSRNITPSRNFGLFFGGSGSFAWLGKSKREDILLNTKNSDPGTTFLQSKFGEINFVQKLELGKGDLKIYSIAFVGWRCLFISQEIQSNKPVSGYENSSKTIWSKNSLNWGGGLGIRYHLIPGLSLDIRGTYQEVDFMKVASVDKSSYRLSTGSYDLSYNFLQPSMLCIKVGILFCLDDLDRRSEHRYFPNFGAGTYFDFPSGGRNTPLEIKVPNVGK